MYRILIADDEGIMLESLKSIILKNFGNYCEVVTVKTGRAVIEQATVFHPDIILMDIQMPGINGIQAVREIRKFSSSTLFYIISAYDKFDYAKEAVALGVEKYLTKPIGKTTVISVIEEAIEKVKKLRRERSEQLRIQEKLEIVIPAVENSFVNNVLFQNGMQDVNYYKQLLEITESYGLVMVFQFGTEYENGRLVSPVGMNIRAMEFYPQFRELVKETGRCVIGPLMSNRIVAILPQREERLKYEERARLVEEGRKLAGRLEAALGAKFRIGIGRNRRFEDLQKSYQEGLSALLDSKSRVIHIEDFQQNGVYDEAFPVETEQKIFRFMKEGELGGMLEEANRFFQWMVEKYPQNKNNIRLKVLEYIIWAERVAFDAGAVNYGFSYRKDYMDIALSFQEYEDLRLWFLQKMTEICTTIRDRQETQSDSVVKKAKLYIQENFNHDISLDEVSKEVNISPYYFSKIFKEESGENFIEYLTRVRMEKAGEMLDDPGLSIKEVSLRSGYPDPNYFSRIFKKHKGLSPREYRERNRK